MDAPPNTPTPEEVLTQADVERLLAQVAAQETAAPPGAKAAAPAHVHADHSVQPYDFRQPAFLTPGELRKLRLRHEEFLRALAARLSIYLRMEFGLQMSRLQTGLYQKFAESLPNPTHVTLFKVEPLRGVCLLDIPPRLGLTLVDRLLGGPAQSGSVDRDLSEIEITLLDQAVQIVLREWCALWTGAKDLKPVILGHENNGRFLQTSTRDTVMLVLAMEVRFGDCLEQMQLVLPFYTLEPLVRQLNASLESETNPEATEAMPAHRWARQYEDVRVPVTAVWPDQEITLRELSQLKPGDVLLLDDQCLSQVNLRLADTLKFSGRLGTRGRAWAVEIKQIHKTS